jgi:predicted dehydrogenase
MTIRLALVGIEHPHGAGYRQSLMLVPEIEVTAAYDPHPDQARMRLPTAWQNVSVYSDLSVLFEQEKVDAALITLPNDQTPEAIIQAAQAGVHVFAEKPCARTASEFRPAAAAIQEAGVQFATGYLRRVSPVGEQIKQAVEDDFLGRLVSVEARWITTRVGGIEPVHRSADHFLFQRARSGGGILHWLGCHWLDFMRWVSNANVTEVGAILDAFSPAGIDVEDTAALALRFDNGMIGSLHCSYVTDQATDQLFFGLRGHKGWLTWERDRDEVTIHSNDPRWFTASTREWRYQPDPMPGYCGAMGVEILRRFAAAICGDAPSLFGPEDAERVLEILDAAQASSQSGKRVRL